MQLLGMILTMLEHTARETQGLKRDLDRDDESLIEVARMSETALAEVAALEQAQAALNEIMAKHMNTLDELYRNLRYQWRRRGGETIANRPEARQAHRIDCIRQLTPRVEKYDESFVFMINECGQQLAVVHKARMALLDALFGQQET